MASTASAHEPEPAQEFTVQRHAQRSWTILALVLLATVAWTWLTRIPQGFALSPQSEAPHTGFIAPPFSLSDADGQSYNLASLKGKIVIVNFWATWCPPCRAEMPAMDQVYRATQADGVIVLAVDQREDAQSVRGYGTSLGLSFPLLLDSDGTLSERYQVHALPTSFFIDRQGVIRDVVYGTLGERAAIEDRLRPLLAATGP